MYIITNLESNENESKSKWIEMYGTPMKGMQFGWTKLILIEMFTNCWSAISKIGRCTKISRKTKKSFKGKRVHV